MIRLFVLFGVLCLAIGTAQGQADRSQTRSVVVTQTGIVAAEHPLAAQAGAMILAQAQAQYVSNIVDHGMNIQAALEAPRFSKNSFGGCDVMMESPIGGEVRAELAKLGHQIRVRGDYAPDPMGSGQAVLRDFAAGVNYGASDPRKDGQAVLEPAWPDSMFRQ